MTERDCISLLQWALPRLRMRWEGFRKVRRQVCKRISGRMRELELPDSTAYRAHLEHHPEEWRVLDSFCRISISRFFRDKAVFQALLREVVPALFRDAAAHGTNELRIWSIGCASGEEPYSLALMWRLELKDQYPGSGVHILATDSDGNMLRRAQEGCYAPGCLRELPEQWVKGGFAHTEGHFCVGDFVREDVEFLEQDIRREMPDGPFHLILCRNLVFTYFEERLQSDILAGIKGRMASGGALVIGAHENLPHGSLEFIPFSSGRGIFLSVDQDQHA